VTALETRAVSIAFGGNLVLDCVGLAVAEGTIHGIIGPNGAGKTTLLNVITGITPPDSGDILLHGASIAGLKANLIAAAGVRRTFQTSLLCKGMTVLENVMAGLHVKLRAGALAAAFGLPSIWRDERDAADAAHEALAYVGADALAERDGGQLSFGQQRIVEIARALISEPRVLLLDEPAVGLSPDRVAHLDALLRRIRDERGVTIVMIEHVIRLVVDVCDRITVMNLGRPIAEGTAAEVTADAGVIEAYLGSVSHAVDPRA
jgi:branched-chain amino acid transport system ATP-binding protein